MSAEKPWIRPTGEVYLGSAALFLAIVDVWGATGFWPVLFCFLTALGPSYPVYKYFSKLHARFQEFFALAENACINLVPSTYKNRVEYNPRGSEEHQKRYYKQDLNGNRRFLVGSLGYITGLETATTAGIFALGLGRLTTRNLNVIGDEEAFKAVDGPMICLGSPTSNNLTSKALRLLPHGIEIEFTTNTMKCWLHDQPYTSSDQIDHAILVRVVDEAHVYFVCAGIDEEGTVAAAKFLFRNWQKLPISSFVQVFQCDKINRTVKQKLGGKHFIKEQEKWITD